MRLKLLFITIALFVVCGRSYGQITIFSENIGTTTGTISIATNVFQNNGLIFSGTGDTRSTSPSDSYSGFSSGRNVYITNVDATDFLISGINTESYTSITLTFGHHKSTTASSNELVVEVSSDGATYNPLTYSRATGTGTATWALISPTGTIPSTANLRIRFRQTSATPQFRVDDIVLTGAVSAITTTGNGAWNSTTINAPWPGGIVPTPSQNVIIAHNVTTDAITRDSGTTTTINNGASLAVSGTYTNNGTTNVNGSFQLDAGGWATGSNFTYGLAGTLNFNGSGSYGVSNTDVFWPITNGPFNVNILQGGVTLNSVNRTVSGTFQTASGVAFNNPSTTTLTLNGTAKINAGGFFNQSPIFGSTSTLIYNSGGPYGRGNEWQAPGVGTIGITPGYPNNIQLSGNTILNYNNGTPSVKAINGNLTIDSGSSFYMDFGGSTSGGVLTVAGNVTNNGNFTLGNTVGDDLRLGGNFTNTGTFNGNNRAVFFTKTGTQIVTSISGITIPYVVLSGGTSVQLATGTNMLISAPNEGNAISFTNSSDVFDINSNTLTIGTNGVANSITGAGTFKGSTTSNLTLLGLGSVGSLNFTTGSQVLKNLTLDRQASNIGFDLGTGVTIDGTLALTNGIANLSNQTMIITLAGLISGASSSNYIIADFTAGGVLRKNFNANGFFTFPIGDRVASADGTQYSPATINFTAANYSSGWAAMSVEDSKEPYNEAPTDFITRYWKLTSFGITSATYNFTGTYLPADISNTETNCKSGRYSTSNSTWTDGNNLVSGANTISLTGLTSSTGALTSPNHFTASYRNREINIKGLTGGTNNIASGSTAANGLNNTLFIATNLGSSTTKDYEIQNLGIAALNLTGIPLVSIEGTNSGDFAVTTVPLTPIIGGASTSFIITFSPTYAGIRTAIVSIANDDGDENPYTFSIQGTGNCATTTNTITPTSGPVGTEVTINSADNLTGTTVSFNGVAATSITYVSSTQIKVIVPSGGISGNIVVTNASGCTATNAFTVVNNLVTSCQGGNGSSDLFISEVTDATTGGLTYVEIYNGTGSTINLSNYALQTFSNGSSTTSSVVNLNNVNLTSGSIYVVALGISPSPDTSDTCSITGGNGQLADQVSTSAGINFDTNGNDYIALYKTSTNIKVDSFGTYENNTWASSLGIGDRGVVFRRKNTATLPLVTYSNSDWDITNWTGSGSDSCSTNDYSDIGTYNFPSGTPPTVTTHPSYTPTCKSTTLTVSGTEGYNDSSPADTKELTYQWLVSAPNATGWTEIMDGTNYSGSSTATLSIANISTIINYQYYCQIRENTNTCYTASNAVKIVDGTITWNGTDWRDVNNAIATPSLSKLAVINSNYNTTTNGDLNACSVIVNAGKVLTVTAQKFVTIQNDLTINSTGTLEVLDKGSLVMINDSGIVTNNGTTNIQRKTTDFELYDYTYWSTPIVSTDIETTFTTLPSYPTDWRIDNAYEFIPANYMDVDNDGFDDNHDDWSFVTSMIPGKGYIIMVPERPSPFPPYTSATVIFSGKVNNGVVTTPIAMTPDVVPAVVDDDFNLVGNPYPSAISADAFINANLSTNGTAYNTIEGTLYFWTHKKDLSANNLGPDALNYSQDDYAVYTLAGGTGTSGTVEGATEDTTNRPTGYIASGQGFFVEAVNPGTLLFNNVMRVGLPATANSQFFKSRPGKSKIKSKDRIWLNLSNSLGMFSQQLVGYFDNTTLGYDNGYDGLLSDAGNYVDFYSFIDNKTYKIQGRAAYDENDQVRLGYFSAVAGTFNINIDSKEGVFANLITPVYLEDKLLNVIYDLKQSPYTFTTEKGTFNDRFILRYTNKTLGNNDLDTPENQVLVSNKNKQIKVNSAVEIIDKVTIYDLLERQLFKKEEVNSNELSIPNLNSSHQTLFIKVILQNGHAVTKKVIY